jgi:cytochrome c peroxidase
MKNKIVFIIISTAIVLMAVPSFAAEEPSVELGRKLFNNPGLGNSKNSISCNTCHQDGEGMQNAGQKPNLAAIINQCIVGPLKGDGISENTPAMASLKMYIISLGK